MLCRLVRSCANYATRAIRTSCAGCSYFVVLDELVEPLSGAVLLLVLPGVELLVLPLMPLVLSVLPAVPLLPLLPGAVPVAPPGVLLLLLPGVLSVAPGVLLPMLLLPAALLSVPLGAPAAPLVPPVLLPPLALDVSAPLLALPLGGMLGAVAALPAALLVSPASFFPQAPKARVATSAASKTEYFMIIPLKKMYF